MIIYYYGIGSESLKLKMLHCNATYMKALNYSWNTTAVPKYQNDLKNETSRSKK